MTTPLAIDRKLFPFSATLGLIRFHPSHSFYIHPLHPTLSPTVKYNFSFIIITVRDEKSSHCLQVIYDKNLPKEIENSKFRQFPKSAKENIGIMERKHHGSLFIIFTYM